MSKIENPMGTDGFEFIEFASLDPKKMETDFSKMGFAQTARHKNKNMILFQQNTINFVLNKEKNSLAETFAREHGPSVCGMGFRVKDAEYAFNRAIQLGAKPHDSNKNHQKGLDLPAIYGIGNSLIYFVDNMNSKKLYDEAFVKTENIDKNSNRVGLTYIDHLTHNVYQGEMDKWAKFYERLFNFREIRYFDIKGQVTGLISRAMTSPCGKIRIPINESTDEQSQIEEFLNDFNGEGIQHIALGTDDIYQSIEAMRSNGIKFLDTPDVYFQMIKDRVPWHQEDLKRLQKDKILLDGTPTSEGGLLLQIFTETMLGPAFFEIIQRKGNQGFGEGNFRALFESIERDQIERGTIKINKEK